jgi:hypothetical protein
MALSDYHKLVEERIQEAIANGEFDNLPGRGKPLDLDEYFSAPEEMRMAFSVLKNANVLPEEIQLLRDIGALQTQLTQPASEADRSRIGKTISEKTVQLNLLMERRKGCQRC